MHHSDIVEDVCTSESTESLSYTCHDQMEKTIYRPWHVFAPLLSTVHINLQGLLVAKLVTEKDRLSRKKRERLDERKSLSLQRDGDIGLNCVLGFIGYLIQNMYESRLKEDVQIAEESICIIESECINEENVEDISSGIICMGRRVYEYKKDEIVSQYSTIGKTPYQSRKHFTLHSSLNMYTLDGNLEKNNTILNASINFGRIINYNKHLEKIKAKEEVLAKKKSVKSRQRESQYHIEKVLVYGLTGEQSSKVILDQSLRTHVSDFEFVSWPNFIGDCRDFCNSFSRQNKRYIYNICERKQPDLNNDYSFYVLKTEEAFSSSALQYISATSVAGVICFRFPILVRRKKERNNISLNITTRRMQFELESEIRSSESKLCMNVTKYEYVRPVITIRSLERRVFTSNIVTCRSRKIVEPKIKEYPCQDGCYPSCMCILLKDIFINFFENTKCNLNLTDTFLSILLDSWITVFKESGNMFSLPFEVTVRVIRGESVKDESGFEEKNNNSGIGSILERVSDNPISEGICQSLRSNDSKSVTTEYCGTTDIESLVNLVRTLEEIIKTWSTDMKLFHHLFPFILRILNHVSIVLQNLSNMINDKRLEELSNSFDEDLLSLKGHNHGPMALLLSLNSILNKINKFSKFFNCNHLTDEKLRYSIFKLYRCYENRDNKLSKVVRRIISVQGHQILFSDPKADRRIQIIENKSKCLINIGEEDHVPESKVMQVQYQSRMSGDKMRSVVGLFLNSLSPSRVRIKSPNTELNYIPHRPMNWTDFKFI